MDFYYGLAQTIGIHTLLGLSAYIVLLTGQVTMAQAAFFAIGAYTAGMLTVLAGWPIVPALGAGAVLGAATACAWDSRRCASRLMLVVATLAFGEGVRLSSSTSTTRWRRATSRSARSAVRASARSATSRRTAGPPGK